METKERILTTALELFLTEGYERTGVQSIVDHAGITKPSLYHHFGNKRGLLQAILDEHLRSFWPKLELASSYKHDITLTLESITQAYFAFALEQNQFYPWYLSIITAPKESDPGQLVRPILERQWNLLKTVFELASADHGNMRGRSERYTLSFLGMVNTYISTYFYGHSELTEEQSHLACKQYMHGIFS